MNEETFPSDESRRRETLKSRTACFGNTLKWNSGAEFWDCGKHKFEGHLKPARLGSSRVKSQTHQKSRKPQK